ncbi:MAG TPA: serine hydrolase [Bryobacteraceae bacterium]|nr:serine hydrolase [Bryobacteraceae bacterium]
MWRVVLGVLAALPLTAQPTASELLEAKVLEEIRQFDRGFDGALGMAAIDLTSGRAFAWHGDTAFPTASMIKIPILVRMFQEERAGRFHFTDRITLNPREAVGGSGRLQFQLKNGPVTLTVRELIAAMIEHSDNTATNKCIDMVGMDGVNQMLDRMGFPQTRLRRKMMDSAAAQRGDENVSTPVEMARLVEQIYRGKAVDERASREILEIMKTVQGDFQAGLPLDVEAASKTGELPGARCQTGVVYLPGRPFALSVMSAFIDDRRTPVPEVMRLVFAYFEKLAASNRYGNRLR